MCSSPLIASARVLSMSTSSHKVIAAKAAKWWFSGVMGVCRWFSTVATLTAWPINSVGSVERWTRFSEPQTLSTDSRKRSISPASVKPRSEEAGFEGAMTFVSGVFVVVRMAASKIWSSGSRTTLFSGSLSRSEVLEACQRPGHLLSRSVRSLVHDCRILEPSTGEFAG
ncbi:hypothetical protein KCU59_g2, partial [Aureobasidium melanogenum]